MTIGINAIFQYLFILLKGTYILLTILIYFTYAHMTSLTSLIKKNKNS